MTQWLLNDSESLKSCETTIPFLDEYKVKVNCKVKNNRCRNARNIREECR